MFDLPVGYIITMFLLHHICMNLHMLLFVVLSKQNTFQLLAPLMEVDGLSLLLSKQYFTSDRRFVLSFPSYLFCYFSFYLKVTFPVFFPHSSDYEDFIRDLARQLCRLSPARVDSYLESAIQVQFSSYSYIRKRA